MFVGYRSGKIHDKEKKKEAAVIDLDVKVMCCDCRVRLRRPECGYVWPVGAN